MSAPHPLSHHEILVLAEPFARAGWLVDLAATDRSARTVAFKPTQQPADGPTSPALRVQLQLESYGTGTCCLTRRLHHPSGLQATAQTIGSQPADLLARLASLAPQQQFRQGPGQVTALSYVHDATPARKGGAAPTQPWVLQQGVVLTDLLQLTLKVSPVKNVAADITLAPRHGLSLDLPEDLLAVQGWDWARLVPGYGPAAGTWTSKRRLRGNSPRRSRTADAAVAQVAAHLVQVLGQPPAQFHQRWWLARWGVVLRRGIPSLTAAALLGTALMLPRMDLGVAPKAWVLLHYLPIGLLALSFGLQELPRFEIPPLPRRLLAGQWGRATSQASDAVALAAGGGGQARQT